MVVPREVHTETPEQIKPGRPPRVTPSEVNMEQQEKVCLEDPQGCHHVKYLCQKKKI